MASKANQIELSLFGQKIVLKHRAEDPELVDQVVALVTRKVKDAQARVPKGSAPHHVALVALLDLSAEYLQAKSRTEKFKDEIDLKSSELAAWIEKELK
jgi:cell division protein ZapA (FtsZ GTPase activity inhibitor)